VNVWESEHPGLRTEMGAEVTKRKIRKISLLVAEVRKPNSYIEVTIRGCDHGCLENKGLSAARDIFCADGFHQVSRAVRLQVTTYSGCGVSEFAKRPIHPTFSNLP